MVIELVHSDNVHNRRYRTVFSVSMNTSVLYVVACSGVQLRNGLAFGALGVVSLPRNWYETRIMLNQMLLLRRLNNYSSAEFSLTLKRFTFKTAECTIKYMPVKTEWLALLQASRFTLGDFYNREGREKNKTFRSFRWNSHTVFVWRVRKKQLIGDKLTE